jgi:RNA polymerase sigma-70 factor (ECF subfamily)
MGMSDLQSMARSVRAAQDAFMAEIEPHRAALWRYCYRLTGSPWDAEDLMQESLVRAFGRLSLVWQPAEPRAYLFRIASNTWIDALRHAGGGSIPNDSVDASGDAPDPDYAESVAALEHLAAALPRTQAVVVLLVDVFDFRVAEVAEMLNVSATAVKGILQRARSSLRVRRDEPERRPSARRTAASDRFVARYVDAFNRRDIDAIAAMLHEHAVVDIVAVGENRGRKTTRADSLPQWAADPLPQRAEAGEFAGERVVFVFAPAADGTEQLHRIDRQNWVDGQIQLSRTYFYTPEILALAGAALGVPAAKNPFTLASIT